MYNVGFTSDGDADLARLDTPIAQRVLRKLRWLAENFEGVVIYTKGKLVSEAETETYYFLVSSKRAL